MQLIHTNYGDLRGKRKDTCYTNFAFRMHSLRSATCAGKRRSRSSHGMECWRRMSFLTAPGRWCRNRL